MQENEEKTARTKSNSRKNLACHPKLKEFIDLANLIPAEYKFLDLDYLFDYAMEKYGYDSDGSRRVNTQNVILAFKEKISDLPLELREYLFALPDNPEWEINNHRNNLGLIEERYSALQSIHNSLISIAYAELAAYEDDSSLTRTFPTLKDIYITRGIYPPFNAALSFFIDEQGFVRIKSNDFLKFVDENDIKADRIRVCLICRKIFWASRSDMRTCQKSCANALRQQRWRERNKETYSEQRKANYAYKKQLKNKQEQRNKENGTL